MATFASKTTIKAMLGIPTGVTTYDSAIELTLDPIDQIILDEIGLSTSGLTTYNESIDILDNGQNSLMLKYAPIGSITALTIDGTAQTLNTDFKVNLTTGRLNLIPIYSFFPTGSNVVEIEYTAGFSSVPSDLIYAGNLIGVSLFNQQSHVGYKSERAGNYQYSMGSSTGSTIPDIARRILNKHHRVFVISN